MGFSLQPVILSGGYGTRLWPLSREDYPKQLLTLTGHDTLFQQTVRRIPQALSGSGAEISPLLVVCNESHRFLIAEQLRLLKQEQALLLLEPIGRNTAPALTLAAIHVLEAHPQQDAVLLVMPADHVIQGETAFQAAVQQGYALAAQGCMVTFGIVPVTPETGYGYIQKARPLTPEGSVFDIARFVEKPPLAVAQEYLESGEFLWNSGLFMVLASVWLAAINRFALEIATHCYDAYLQGRREDCFYRVNTAAFTGCPNQSIDYAVMEKLGAAPTPSAVVIPLAAGWSDVGSWPALWQISPQDTQGNVSQGDVFLHHTQNSLVLSEHRFVAALGVEDLIIVESADAVLIVSKACAQEVKAVTDYLKQQKRTEYRFHRKVHRPWGSFDSLEEGERFKVKRLIVNPGAAISLQMHYHRAEHWVVVKGTAKVTCGDKTVLLTENQSTFISATTVHRLENPGTIPLEVIEVQSGSYLGEEDIVRFQDNYKRGV